MKIGIISFAHMHAWTYANLIKQHPDAELAGIWDADVQRGTDAAQKLTTQFYANLDELLQTDLDAVVICSENAKHKEHVIKAASYQKHILCEKPIATEIEDAKEMITACEVHHVIFQIAFPVRFSPDISRVKNLLKSGHIGEIMAINTTNHGQMPGGWFVDKKLSGGGAATDHIVHITDLLRWLLNDEVKHVYAELDTRFFDIEVEDCGIVTLELESDIIVSIDPSWSRPKTFPTWGDVTLKFIGTEGSIVFDAYKQHSVFYNDIAGKTQHLSWAENMNAGLMNDFIECVKIQRKPFITGIDGLRTLEVVKAAYESNMNGKTILIKKA